MDASANWLATEPLRNMWNRMARRWCSFGPYYAMFPVSFARAVIAEQTKVGDIVLDPFAGRGTTLFCANEAGRGALGCDLNPLGWVYTSTKLCPAPPHLVLRRLREVTEHSSENNAQAAALPEFFQKCFCPDVLAFLITSRNRLSWKESVVDRTLMAFILTYMHGKINASGRPQALSNQMRQTKAMAPDYSVRWWDRNGFSVPPEIDPLEFLTDRIQWRYALGAPKFTRESAKLGDCRAVLPRCRSKFSGKAQLLLTSPPYCGVTSYYYDQWLRSWLLGEPARPKRDGSAIKGKFESVNAYQNLLRDAFSAARPLLHNDASIYVRTDARPRTLGITLQVLGEIFPHKRMERVEAPFNKPTQTSLFGDKSPKPGEMDIILR